ncbi:IQ calmodulin-binding motif protein (macronuclear) [Tetrahymena thermophila SB210]|uniref:IQ calmodulin-binding motif protein n=1 Tax=Tetrahymena thermophila (strain SB210) TaxID=312017 RepID=Q22KK2_TETTS|nr:IQ calmodulin-binding motif protein [Tetrahymena thermophila SB210]EAR85797.2 IQ calmodulin-binding motif protein [Tetrahymena thermophila SB210]|eukprot:XP_001033460.2 IQ calmodulin-binding motif protein [Tetrahymena thermophila SB210]
MAIDQEQLQTYQQIDNCFKEFQAQNDQMFQSKQELLVQKIQQEKQKQSLLKFQQSRSPQSSQTYTLKRKPQLIQQLMEKSSQKESLEQTPTSSTNSNKQQNEITSNKKQLNEKQGLQKLIKKVSEFSQVKDFVWFVNKLAKSSKKYDFLKDDEICKQFGIDFRKLEQIQEIEKRQKYIVYTLISNINQQIENFDYNSNTDQKAIEIQEQLQIKQFLKDNQTKKNDILEWIRVNSKYDNLEKKIKLCLVENIHHPQNTEYLIEQKQLQNQNIKIRQKSNKKSIHLKIVKHDDIPQTDNSASIAESKESFRNRKDLKEALIWNNETEAHFNFKKAQIKNNLSQKIPSSNWYNLSMIPIIQEVQVDQGVAQYREQLMEKFKNREALTDKELQFLATTNELLNRNIDKNYVQDIINNLDEQVIDEIETGIAEEIIMKYNKLIEIAKEKRNEYLKRKASISGKIIQNNDYLKRVKEEKSEHYHSNLMKNKIIEKLIEGYKLNEIKMHVIKQDNLLKNFGKSLNDKFENELPINLTLHSQKCKEFYSKQVPDKNKQLKTLYSLKNGEEITIEKSQRLFHPSSMLILNSNLIDDQKYQKTDGIILSQQEIAKLSQQKEKMVKQRMFIKNSIMKNKKDLFQTFYSSGPLDAAEEYGGKNQKNEYKFDLPKRNPWITDEIRTHAAIIIQKNYRMRIAKKKAAILDEQKISKLIKRTKTKMAASSFMNHLSSFAQQLQSFEQQQKTNKVKPSTPKKNHKDTMSPRERQILINMKFKNKQEILQDSIIGDNQSVDSDDQNYRTKNSTPMQSAKKGLLSKSRSQNLQDTTFVSTTLGAQSPQSIVGNTFQRQDFSSFIEKLREYKEKGENKRSSGSAQLPKNNIQLSRSSTMFNKTTNVQTDISIFQETNKSRRGQNLLQLDDFQRKILSTQGSESVKNGSKNFNLLTMQEQIASLNLTPQQQQTKRQKNSQNLAQNIKSLKSELKKTKQDEQQRQNDLEKLRARMFKNTLLVKQQKLISAAQHNTFQAIKNAGYLLSSSDVNIKDKQGNTPLYYTVMNKNEEFVQYLVDLGANVNEPCQNGNTPLHMAFQIQNEKIIMDFMEKGGDLNIVNQDQQTPIAMGSFELIKKMGLENAVAKISNLDQNSNNNNLIKKQSISQSVDNRYTNGALKIDLTQQFAIDNNSVFKQIYTKKTTFSYKNKNMQKRANNQHFNEEILADIDSVGKNQNAVYQIKNILRENQHTIKSKSVQISSTK